MSIEHCPACSGKPHSQDDLHGKGRRVFNEDRLKDGRTRKRCTRCGHELTASAKAEEPKSK